MFDLIQHTIGPAVTWELKSECEPWPVLCDPNQLENAVLNLIINARDAMGAGGGALSVEISHSTLDLAEIGGWEGAEAGDYVRITVTDDGDGMTPDVMSRAFEPFYTTKPHGQGTDEPGADMEVLGKPFNLEVLASRVKGLIDRRRA